MTRSQAEQLLKQEVRVWPQANDILLAQVRDCCFLSPPGKAVSRLSFYGGGVSTTLFTFKGNDAAAQTWNLAVKLGLRFFSQVRAGGMQV